VLTAAAYDLRWRRVPNWLTGVGIAIGFAGNVMERGLGAGLVFAIAGFGLALGVYLGLYALRAVGGGDAKLMAAIGAIVGWREWGGIFLCTALLGGVAAVVVSLARGRLKKTLRNAGLALSELAHGRPAYLANEELDVRSPKALRLPHAAVIAAGALTYLALHRGALG
jgi:prepilin peptidase CpaA